MHSHSSILKTIVNLDLFVLLIMSFFTFAIISSFLYNSLHEWYEAVLFLPNIQWLFFFHFCTDQLDKKEEKENKAHHAQRQENEDQPRGESSSSITSKTRIYFRGKVTEKGRDFVRYVDVFADDENARNFMSVIHERVRFLNESWLLVPSVQTGVVSLTLIPLIKLLICATLGTNVLSIVASWRSVHLTQVLANRCKISQIGHPSTCRQW